MWKKIKQTRTSRCDITCRPRLRTLRVLQGPGPYGQDHFQGHPDTPECRGQIAFEARLSELDDLAQEGEPDVVCLELEALQEKYGRPPLAHERHEKMMDRLVAQAEDGRISSRLVPGAIDDELLRHLRTPLLAMADAECSAD